MGITLLFELKAFYTVCRHTPGKLMLRVDPAVANHPRAALLKQVGQRTIPGILRARMNVFTNTLTIWYDTAVLSYDSMCALLHESTPACVEQAVV